MALAADDARHGTENGYNNLHCRCDACTTAHRLYYRERRKNPAFRETTRKANRAAYRRRKAQAMGIDRIREEGSITYAIVRRRICHLQRIAGLRICDEYAAIVRVLAMLARLRLGRPIRP